MQAKSPSVVRVISNGKTNQEVMADAAVEGVMNAGISTSTFAGGNLGEIDLAQAVKALRAEVRATEAGKMGIADRFLVGQAVTLDAIFHELARRSALNIGAHPEAFERYMRLALKAQSQCRTSLESLAMIKNPRHVAFVRQTNVAHGAQQVNNEGNAARVENQTGQNKLLEHRDEANWLDGGKAGATIGGDSPLEAVAEVVRAPKRCRKARVKS